MHFNYKPNLSQIQAVYKEAVPGRWLDPARSLVTGRTEAGLSALTELQKGRNSFFSSLPLLTVESHPPSRPAEHNLFMFVGFFSLKLSFLLF